MKTSNKIIIAFGVFFLAGIIAVFITVKLNERFVEVSTIIQTRILQPFSVVVAEDSAEVEIYENTNHKVKVTSASSKNLKDSTNNTSAIDVAYLKQNGYPKLPYKQNGDTLFLYKGAKLTVHSSTNIRSVIGKNHLKMGLFKLAPDTLKLTLTGGKTTLDNANIKKKICMVLKTKKNSELDVYNTQFKTLTVNAEGGKINFKKGVGKAMDIMLKMNSNFTIEQ